MVYYFIHPDIKKEFFVLTSDIYKMMKSSLTHILNPPASKEQVQAKFEDLKKYIADGPLAKAFRTILPQNFEMPGSFTSRTNVKKYWTRRYNSQIASVSGIEGLIDEEDKFVVSNAGWVGGYFDLENFVNNLKVIDSILERLGAQAEKLETRDPVSILRSLILMGTKKEPGLEMILVEYQSFIKPKGKKIEESTGTFGPILEEYIDTFKTEDEGGGTGIDKSIDFKNMTCFIINHGYEPKKSYLVELHGVPIILYCVTSTKIFIENAAKAAAAAAAAKAAAKAAPILGPSEGKKRVKFTIDQESFEIDLRKSRFDTTLVEEDYKIFYEETSDFKFNIDKELPDGGATLVSSASVAQEQNFVWPSIEEQKVKFGIDIGELDTNPLGFYCGEVNKGLENGSSHCKGITNIKGTDYRLEFGLGSGIAMNQAWIAHRYEYRSKRMLEIDKYMKGGGTIGKNMILGDLEH
jgi:hypothetical protein